MVRQWQTLFFNNRLSGVQARRLPGCGETGRAYGFKGETVDKPADLGPALERAVKEPGPYLLNVKSSPMECVYPMVPAGSAMSEMVFGPPQWEAIAMK